ncbi:MAG: disulfide bond formation protein DsbA [Rhodobacterales bacterium]
MSRRLSICAAALVAGLFCANNAALAQTILSSAERAALGAEIRALLLDEPEIVEQALNPPSAYEEAVSADRARLDALAPRLFAPEQTGFGDADAALRIAFFTAEDCAECDQALADLRDLAETHDLRVTLFAMDDDGPDAALAAELGLEQAPSYVLPDMMMQGHIPQVVLERYLAR